MLDRTQYVESLRGRLEELKSDIIEHQDSIRELFELIETKQAQIHNIAELLAAEDIHLNDPDLAAVTDAPIADLAYKFLNTDADHKPYHYTEIAKNLMSQGILIPGKNPSANLLTHISRDNRFVRTASGTYGLVEDGHKPAKKLMRKRKK